MVNVTKNKIPPSEELYIKIVKTLKGVFGDDVVIAGGCLRDLSYGYEPKDVDVFVNLPDELSLELLIDEAWEALNGLGLGNSDMYNLFDDNRETDYNQEAPIEEGPSCVSVFCFNFVDFAPEIQIIAKPLKGEWSGKALMDTFDYNLVCQYLDEDGIHGTEEVQKQILERAIYLKKTGDKKNANGMTKTEERLHRFLARTNFEPSNKEELPQIFRKKKPRNSTLLDFGSSTMTGFGGTSGTTLQYAAL